MKGLQHPWENNEGTLYWGNDRKEVLFFLMKFNNKFSNSRIPDFESITFNRKGFFDAYHQRSGMPLAHDEMIRVTKLSEDTKHVMINQVFKVMRK